MRPANELAANAVAIATAFAPAAASGEDSDTDAATDSVFELGLLDDLSKDDLKGTVILLAALTARMSYLADEDDPTALLRNAGQAAAHLPE